MNRCKVQMMQYPCACTFSQKHIYAEHGISFPCQNLLALGGEDKCITVSNVDGDTIRQVSTHVIKIILKQLSHIHVNVQHN